MKRDSLSLFFVCWKGTIMIIIMKPNTSPEDVNKLKAEVELLGCKASITQGENYAIIGLVGDTANINLGQIEARADVDKVVRVAEPYKKVNRLFHPQDTIIQIRDTSIGGDELAIIAGPCAVESEEQLLTIAKIVKEMGATFLRGGAFKPRTSPYSFQGMGQEGIEILKEARRLTGLPIVTEMMSPAQVGAFADDVDVIQIGARNMQNFDLLKAVGETRVPVLLKRGMSATLEEFLMAAEYIMAGGNDQVVLCERGIRTFETFTRNTLDISAVPILKRKSHLPVVVDPSHAAGIRWLVEPLAKAAVAAGADGLTVEVHHQPEKAMSDGQQSLYPEDFKRMLEQIRPIRKVIRGVWNGPIRS